MTASVLSFCLSVCPASYANAQAPAFVIQGRTVDSTGAGLTAVVVARAGGPSKDSLGATASAADGAFRLVLIRASTTVQLEARVGVKLVAQAQIDSAILFGPAARPLVLRLRGTTQLASVQVRARYQRRPSVFGFFEGEPGSRIERSGPGTTDWLDPLSVGTSDALFASSPELLVLGDGFSALGAPGSSNQVQIGGVRVPQDLITGQLNGNVTISPWDATIGGAAGATLNLFLAPASPVQTSHATARTGVSGVPASLHTPEGRQSASLPAQVSIGLSGPVGKLGYRLNVFAAGESSNIARWDERLPAAARLQLDSLSRVAGVQPSATSDRMRRAGFTGRVDLTPYNTRRVLSLTAGASMNQQSLDGVTDLVAASATQQGVEQSGFLQLESTRVYHERVLSTSLVTVSQARTRTDLVSRAPRITIAEPTLGQLVAIGGGSPEPERTVSAAEARSSATWYSANNRSRFVAQMQLRFESVHAGTVGAHDAFNASSFEDAAAGRAAALVRTNARSATDVSSFVAAPSLNLRRDLGRNGALSLGARADGWVAKSFSGPDHIRAIDVSPRASLLRRLYLSPKSAQPFGTIRMGVGRFTDWPGAAQWSDASANASVVRTTCSGSAVPALDLTANDASCLAGAAQVQTRVEADRSLRSVRADRADLSLSLARFLFGTRAEFGASAAQTRDILVRVSPFSYAPLAGVLVGDGGRGVYTPPAMIGPDGSVPTSAGVNSNLTTLTSAARSSAMQLRARIVSRNPFARARMEAAYAYTLGRETGWSISDALGAPRGATGPLLAAGRHTLAFSAGVWASDVEIRFSGLVRSGAHFTPLADRDLNGDARANDPVFVPLSEQASFEQSVPAHLRGCIRANAGRLAEPGPCTGPSSVTSLLFATIPGVHLRLPQGSSIDVSFSNPLGLLAGAVGGDALVFGRPLTGSPVLARVTGYSPDKQLFRTEPLSGFGTVPGYGKNLTEPLRFSFGVRLPIGRSVTAQRAATAMAAVRMDTSTRALARAAAQFFSDVPPLPAIVLQGSDEAGLTAGQRAVLDTLMGRWQKSTTELFAEAAVSRSQSRGGAVERLTMARVRFLQEVLDIAEAIRRVLSADQIERLPDSIQRLLNPRFLRFLATQDAATG